MRRHLIPMTEQMWPIQLSGLSVREEADRSGSHSVKPRLEGVDGRRVDDLLWETRRFHLSVTRSEKKWRLRSSRHLFFIILAVCPLVTVSSYPVLVFMVLRLSRTPG